MKKIKFYFWYIVAKILYYSIKITGRSASHFPGRIATHYFPEFLKYIKKPKCIIGVTGTNGKTTTANLIIDMLSEAGYKVLSNRKGSNLDSGIATALIASNHKEDIAVFEIDEKSARVIFPYIKPDFLICTNLFRDSIVRNAHSEYILNIINKYIPSSSKLILNGNCLISSQIGKDNKKIYYGIDDIKEFRCKNESKINDARVCPKCYSTLEYKFTHYHHIGRSVCPSCKFESPALDYAMNKVNFDENILFVNDTKYPLVSNNLFNIYNEVAVISFFKEFGFDENKISMLLSKIHITETRYTKEVINDITVITNMAKGLNAVACSRNFDMVKNDDGNKIVMLFLDDVFDAKNSSEPISWIFETDFEFLNDKSIRQIIVGGVRSLDYKFRLLLSGIDKEKIYITDNELDMYKYLKLDDIDKIYILYELYAYDKSIVVKKQVKDFITNNGDVK